MRRRDAIMFLGSAAFAWPIPSIAQKRPVRIGFLGTGAAETSAIFVEALKEGLRENGLIEGRDYEFEFGWAEGNYERFPSFAARMVQSNVSVILATTIVAVRAAQRATNAIPIVMTSINDPVGTGLVKSLARPGGNTTGLASLAEDVSTKLVELLRETIPRATNIAVLLNPANPSNPAMLTKIATLLANSRIKTQPIEVRSRAEFDLALSVLDRRRPDALLILPDFMLIDARETISTLALRYRMPAITNVPEYTDAGALISFGAPRRANYRRSAHYVKRILDGANPADLPIEQPTRIELSINLKTAKALGIPIPAAMLARADTVIE